LIIRNVEFTLQSIEDIKNIQDYLTDYPNPLAKLINRFNICIKIIKSNPKLGKKEE
jgi:hypothetical protein